MVIGIGVDMVDIRRMEKLISGNSETFVSRVFTEAERAAAPGDFFLEAKTNRRVMQQRDVNESFPEPGMEDTPTTIKPREGSFSRRDGGNFSRRAEYYAARFAVKEAVFKAIAHVLPEKTFDLRKVESLSHEDGAPYVVMDGALSETYQRAGAEHIFLSITTEDHFAVAYVVAEG